MKSNMKITLLNLIAMLAFSGAALANPNPDQKTLILKNKDGAAILAARLKDLQENREYHAAAIQKVIDEQMDATVAQQMNAGGGGRTVLDSALDLLMRVCPL